MRFSFPWIFRLCSGLRHSCMCLPELSRNLLQSLPHKYWLTTYKTSRCQYQEYHNLNQPVELMFPAAQFEEVLKCPTIHVYQSTQFWCRSTPHLHVLHVSAYRGRHQVHRTFTTTTLPSVCCTSLHWPVFTHCECVVQVCCLCNAFMS
jgi:hypothetical protein